MKASNEVLGASSLPAVACSCVKMPRLLWRWLFTHMCVLHPYTYIPLTFSPDCLKYVCPLLFLHTKLGSGVNEKKENTMKKVHIATMNCYCPFPHHAHIYLFCSYNSFFLARHKNAVLCTTLHCSQALESSGAHGAMKGNVSVQGIIF